MTEKPQKRKKAAKPAKAAKAAATPTPRRATLSEGRAVSKSAQERVERALPVIKSAAVVGCSIKQIAAAANVPARTLGDWFDKGADQWARDKRQNIFYDVHDAIRTGRDRGISVVKQRLYQLATGENPDIRAVQTFLERAEPQGLSDTTHTAAATAAQTAAQLLAEFARRKNAQD